MHKIIIGSTAGNHWFDDYPRKPKDLDFVVNIKSMWDNSPGVEYFENDVLYNNQEQFVKDGYITPDGLYTLKMSHVVGWDINWDKHVYDIQYLKSKGCKLDLPFFYDLYEYWNEIQGKNRRSDLAMSAEDFFDNALKCDYDHDYLHTLLAEVPTFTKVLADGAEVEVSEDKFNKLTFEEKCNLVYEEVMIMAFERYSHMDFRLGYYIMLKKFILSHAPIWEAIFILENYKHIQKCPFNYIKFLREKLNLQKV